MSASQRRQERLLPCSLMLVKSIAVVGSFLEKLFDAPARVVVEVPCRHTVIIVSPDLSVILVESSSCDEEMKATFGSCDVKHLFVQVQSSALHDIQKR